MLPKKFAAALLFLLILFAGFVVFYLPPPIHEDSVPQSNNPQREAVGPPRTKGEIQAWLDRQKIFEEEMIERNKTWMNAKTKSDPTEEYIKKEEFVKALNQTYLNELVKKLTYWENNPFKNKPPRPVNTNKFMTWMPYSAGLNNRRISMEIAYVFALITGRTLVLPPISGWQNPFPVPFLMEELHDEDDLRAGVPMMTWKEWLNFPERENIWDDTVLCPWDLKYGNGLFVFPKIPAEEEPTYAAFAEYVSNHRELIHIRDPYTVHGFATAKNIYFPENMMFIHFYHQFYFMPDSPFQMKDITKSVRDHVHFPARVLEFVARILYFLPSFSAMHYRRDDFVYETGKLSPAVIFNETHKFYQDNETIYVSTDEKRDAFVEQFLPAFEGRYRVVTLFDFNHLLYDMPPMYEPMIEMLVCSSARVFVGTMLSTYSGYIQRLRGYHKWIEDKGPHYTQEYRGGIPLWGQERPEAWDKINDEEDQVRFN